MKSVPVFLMRSVLVFPEKKRGGQTDRQTDRKREKERDSERSAGWLLYSRSMRTQSCLSYQCMRSS
jgi:hypothetical protein